MRLFLVQIVLIVLGFYDTSTLVGHLFLFVLRFYGPVNPMGSCRAWSVYLTTRLVGHFMSSPRKGRKEIDSRGDEREVQGIKRNRNEREETEEIKTFPSTLTCYQDSTPCPTVSQYQLDALVM